MDVVWAYLNVNVPDYIVLSKNGSISMTRVEGDSMFARYVHRSKVPIIFIVNCRVNRRRLALITT